MLFPNSGLGAYVTALSDSVVAGFVLPSYQLRVGLTLYLSRKCYNSPMHLQVVKHFLVPCRGAYCLVITYLLAHSLFLFVAIYPTISPLNQKYLLVMSCQTYTQKYSMKKKRHDIKLFATTYEATLEEWI